MGWGCNWRFTINENQGRHGTSKGHGTLGYHSGLEIRLATQLKTEGTNFLYEPIRLEYTQPARVAGYTPDFILPNGIIIEAKGKFQAKDRQKHVLIKEQLPGLDIRFVFSRAAATISKKSKTTYAM